MSDTDLLSSATPDAAPPDNQPGTGFAEAAQGEGNDNGAPTRRRGLSSMVLAELRQLARQLGIADTAGMRKGDLIAAIKQHQSAAQDTERAPEQAAQLPLDVSGPSQSAPVSDPVSAEAAPAPVEQPATPTAPEQPVATEQPTVAEQPTVVEQPVATEQPPAADQPTAAEQAAVAERSVVAEQPTTPEQSVAAEQPAGGESQPAARTEVRRDGDDAHGRGQQRRRSASRPAGSPDRQQSAERSQGDRHQGAEQRTEQRGTEQTTGGEQRTDGRGGDGTQQAEPTQQSDRGESGPNGQSRGDRGDDGDDDSGGRRRGRRFRDRRRNRDRRPEGGNEPEVREDDVLLPVAGILDVLENYAFVRTSGYLAGPNDVYVSLSLVRKYGLRRGDAITGAVRQPREGEQQRQKFNPLVRVDTINGLDVDAAKQRPEFTRLTPLYPNERLRLETESHKLTTRVIDLVMPVGKGQRALIVSPPKAGKTMVLQAIANAITTNNPECHLMVVLVDERPEEVTDMQRSVKGEVIASTFDRPPSDHTTVSELAIERAKRLVEMGHDVVVLLDSITRLGRAYNLAAPASGRILSGGVDSTALYPPKRFLGAARNIEGGGSLTIFATALVETGSTGDGVIFEEFKGTGNAELKLDRKIADRRVFPAVDVTISGTRKEELLLSPDEMAVTIKLRRVLTALDPQQAIDLILDRLRKTRTNVEFLMQVAKTTPLSDDD